MTPLHSWRLDVFGTPRLTRPDGSSLHPEGGALALLTYLALEGPTTRSRLAGLLWPDTVESAARNNLVHLLRRIGRVYGEGLLRPGDVVDLAAQVEVDARAFLESTREAATKGGSYDTLLAGVEFDDRPDLADWLLAWRERLGNLQVQVLTRRAGQQEDQGDLTAAITTTQRLLDLNPVAEEGWRRLMRLHYLAGDRGAALAAFERCKEMLHREFGAEPLPETWQVAREVERGDILVKPAAHTPRIPLSVLRPPGLVGRDDAWAAMETAWAAGQFIVLAGEAGVGKSRLARDFAASKGEVLHLEGRPGDALVPHATTVRNLQRILAHSPDLPLQPWMRRSLARLLPDLLASEAEQEASEPDTRLHAAIRYVFETGLQGVGAVVYDDLHLADQASVEVGFVLISSSFPLGQPGSVPKLICTVRSDETPAFLEDMLRRGSAAGHNAQVNLGPLGPAAVETLVRELDVPAVRDLGPQLARFTGGNPLFILETVKHLIETPTPHGSLPVAARASQLIEGRLGRLSPAAVGAARAAAVLQGDVRIELVAAVLGAPLLDTAAAWEELEATQIMTGERFSHDLVRETVLTGLPPSVRRLLNRSAARVLGREGVSAARIARHWQEGGAPEAAAPLLVQAAAEALARLRPMEAVAFLEQAADLYEASGDRDAAFDALARAVESPWRSEEVDALEPIMERLVALAGTHEQRARLGFLRAARLLGRNQPDAAEHAALEGLAALSGHSQPRLRVALLRELVQARGQQGDVQATLNTVPEILAIGDTLSDERERALGEVAVGGALLRLGHLEAAEPHLRRATALFDAQGDAYRAAWATHNLAVAVQHGRHDLRAAVQLRENLSARLDQVHMPTLYRGNLAELGLAYLRLREYAQALLCLHRVKAHDEGLGEGRSSYDRSLTDLYWTLGAYGACEASAWRALKYPDPRDSGASLSWLYVGRIRALRGDAPGAQEAYDHLEASLEQHDFTYTRGLLLLGRAEINAPALAVDLATQALDLARAHAHPELETQALSVRAQALLTLGRLQDAHQDSAAAVARLPDAAPRDDYAHPLLVHHRVTAALAEGHTRQPLHEALVWLKEAVTRVPGEYRQAFLEDHVTHRALRAAGPTGLDADEP